LYNFPQRRLEAAATPFYFDAGLDDEGVSGLFEQILEVGNSAIFLEETNTQAFIVIQDDTLRYEKYLNSLL
jgi:hypothetical protein